MSEVKFIQFSKLDLPSNEISRREVLRYMGCKQSSEEIESLISKGICECEEKLSYKVIYRELPLAHNDGSLDLGFMTTKSQDLRKALHGCDSCVLFAATLGLEIDRSINRYSHISPSLALAIQAIGAERIEALCDKFSQQIKKLAAEDHKNATPRFSPGYGDFPLEAQREIFKSLPCEKMIGVTLLDSLLMSPTKSVTAIIGIKK